MRRRATRSAFAEAICLRLATYQNGTPTTIIGPPTAGTFALA
ncbi:MAG TPA: hypothetical protein PKM73_18335 [Verrucomicrobiota bacterium]|nr:hypothetical protein [Verrucomicrobiota bacterium]HNU53024.1 hypothetical protein [Verrucomicrobiota bacterium]